MDRCHHRIDQSMKGHQYTCRVVFQAILHWLFVACPQAHLYGKHAFVCFFDTKNWNLAAALKLLWLVGEDSILGSKA